MPPNLQAALDAMRNSLMERLDRRIDGLESRIGKGEEDLDAKYMQLLEKIDNLNNRFYMLVITSILLPTVLFILSYYLSHK